MTFAASSDNIVFDLILERVRNDLTDLESRAKYLEGGNLSVANWRNYNLAKSEKALLATAAHVRRIREKLETTEALENWRSGETSRRRLESLLGEAVE